MTPQQQAQGMLVALADAVAAYLAERAAEAPGFCLSFTARRMFCPVERFEDLKDEDFTEFNPFHPLEGANFKIKIKKQGDYPNYDDSAFSMPKPLFAGDEKKINAAIEACYGLAEFLAPEKFPTNEETMRVLGSILGAQPEPAQEIPPQPAQEPAAEPPVDGAADVPWPEEPTGGPAPAGPGAAR